MASTAPTIAQATGAENEIRMILLGRTGAGEKFTLKSIKNVFIYSLLKAKVLLVILFLAKNCSKLESVQLASQKHVLLVLENFKQKAYF